MAAAPASLSLANDGEALIEQYHGASLLDREAVPTTRCSSFAATARSFAGLTLGDLIAAPTHLPTTVSHRVWATAFGIDSRGDYVIETVEGRRFRFALPDARSMAPGRGR